MMLGWFKNVGLVLLAGVLLSGCAGHRSSPSTVSINDLETLKCEEVTQKDIFLDPKKYENKRICTIGYFYYVSGHLSFPPNRVSSTDELYKLEEEILLGTSRHDIWNFLEEIPHESKLRIEGNLTFPYQCWFKTDEEKAKPDYIPCLPVSRPIYLDDVIITLEK